MVYKLFVVQDLGACTAPMPKDRGQWLQLLKMQKTAARDVWKMERERSATVALCTDQGALSGYTCFSTLPLRLL